MLSGAGFLCRLAAKALNYRHAFHAGNFADLVKHAALLQLLGRLTTAAEPLSVIDTHAGRGLYDLAGADSRCSGEALSGIARLMEAREAPAEFEPLRAAVSALNPKPPLRWYPGSPWLISRAIRDHDRYLACELRADEHAALLQTIRGHRNARALCADGYQAAARETPARGPGLVLVDPPFERPDDYSRIVETMARVARSNRSAVVLAWLPLKDLATFDAFVGDLQDGLPGARLLIAEARVRPLTDPMRMNGCALALANGPPDFAAPLHAICGWVAGRLGNDGAARVYPA